MKKSELKSFLKTHNLKESDLDEIWKDCSMFPEYGGEIVKRLNDQGMTWGDLNILALSSLLEVYKKIETQILKELEEDEEECN